VDAATRAGQHRAGFENDVFISSTAETRESAGLLTEMLSNAGLRVWTDSSSLQGGDTWDDTIERQLDGSQHIVVLLGDKPSAWQAREATYVLRQSIDDDTDRRVIPVYTSAQSRRSVPTALRSLAGIDLKSASLEDAARMISEISGESRPGPPG
jgi:hypothetical protein